MPKVRLAIPRELDFRPLVWSFLKGHHQGLFQPVEYSADRILPLVAQGEVEVGLVPSAAYLRRHSRDGGGTLAEDGAENELGIVDDICAAAHAQSLVLLSHVPFDEVASVDLSRASTSVATLARVVLADSLGHDIEMAPWREESLASGADAILLPSDLALSTESSPAPYVIDLVELWKRQTSLPLVLSLWAFSKKAPLPDLEFYLKSSLRYGLSSLETLSRELAAERGLEAARVSSHLDNNLSYVLGAPERLGLQELRHRLESVESAETVSL